MENNQDKRAIFDALLIQCSQVFVHLDARLPGVNVPKQYWTQHNLLLDYGLDLAIPITDLKLCEDGISATLSFNRGFVFTFVPWDSIYVIRSNEGHVFVFPSSAPAEFELSIPEAQLPAVAPKGRVGPPDSSH